MELLSGVSDPLDQVRFHKAVDVFIFTGDLKRPVLHVPLDSVQTLKDRVPLLFREDSLLCQHFHMGSAARDILLIEFLVKRYGRIEVVDQLVRLLGKASAP